MYISNSVGFYAHVNIFIIKIITVPTFSVRTIVMYYRGARIYIMVYSNEINGQICYITWPFLATIEYIMINMSVAH